MEARPIRTEEDYEAAMARIEELWGISTDSRGSDELDVLIALTGVYEREHFPIEPPDPWAILEYRPDQMGLTEDQIGRFMAAGKKVPELFCRESGLSLEDFMSLRDIPLEALTADRP